MSSQNSKIAILVLLFILSCVSVFGFYNTFTFSLYSMFTGMETIEDKFYNGIILAVFSATAFYLNSVYTRTKGFTENLKVLGIAAAALGIIAICLYFTSSVVYALIAMIVVGTSVAIFTFAIDTIGKAGAFVLLAVMIFIPVLVAKSTDAVDFSAMFTIMQSLLAVVVFIGTTFTRIRALLFQIRTGNVTNIEEASENNDDKV